MAVLLLTGATGMVGREILARAATDDRFAEVVCLIRATAKQTAGERLDALCAAMGVPATAPVRALSGDVSEPDLGVAATELATVTHVIHCAASVSFDLPLAQARAINVAGTAHVLAACRAMPDFERLDAVSTCYVAGRRTGLIKETDLTTTPGSTTRTNRRSTNQSNCCAPRCRSWPSRSTDRRSWSAIHAREPPAPGRSCTGRSRSSRVADCR